MESALYPGSDPGLRLIETFASDAGAGRIARHRARMAAGAAALGWGFDAAGFDRQVAAMATGAPMRLRLTLGAEGGFEAQAAPMPVQARLWRLALSEERLWSDDPWLSLKSTRRGAYDRARAAMPEGVDEVLLLNERGEVCEGTITTVFFDRGQGMRTPPLSSGLLPGVLRAEMACREEVLLPEDLPKLRLWVGNSLRGLIAAQWLPG